MVVQEYGQVANRPHLELHGRPPIKKEVREAKIGALVGASRVGKTSTKEAIERMHPGGIVWIPKRCVPRILARPEEGQGHVLATDIKDLLKLQGDQLVTSIVDPIVPKEVKEYLKKRFGFTPPSTEEIVRFIYQFLAVFLISDIEEAVENATDDQIVLVELSVWDVPTWKTVFPNTEIFWLEAPPDEVVKRHRQTYKTGLRSVYARARLTEALLSLLSPPIELLLLNPRRLSSVVRTDTIDSARYIWETLRG